MFSICKVSDESACVALNSTRQLSELKQQRKYTNISKRTYGGAQFFFLIDVLSAFAFVLVSAISSPWLHMIEYMIINA